MPKKTAKRAAARPRRVLAAPAEAMDVHDDSGVVDLATMPVIMRIDEVARVYRRAPGTVYRELRRGTFRGAKPYDTGRPFRWLRDDIEADLKRRRKH